MSTITIHAAVVCWFVTGVLGWLLMIGGFFGCFISLGSSRDGDGATALGSFVAMLFGAFCIWACFNA